MNYSNFCSIYKENYSKLKGKVYFYKCEKTIANIFSQKENYDTDYKCLKVAFQKVKKFAKRENLSIAIPYKYGCGIANGDWNFVYKIIQETFKNDDIKCTIYKLDTIYE